MEGIPKDMIEKLKVVFGKLDVNHDGKVSKAEIQDCCKKLHYDLPDAIYEEMFKHIDPVGKMMTFEQMFTVKTFYLPLIFAFIMTDVNGDGQLSFDEVKAAAHCSPTPIPPDDKLRALFNAIDTNKDGGLSLEEFIKFFGGMAC